VILPGVSSFAGRNREPRERRYVGDARSRTEERKRRTDTVTDVHKMD
jgi:hypothetical protein